MAIKEYMRIRSFVAFVLPLITRVFSSTECPTVANGCVSFTVSAGTGCAWMCEYCANQLGTNNYYFTDGVCSYQSGEGCVGNPVAGKTYTCCSVSNIPLVDGL